MPPRAGTPSQSAQSSTHHLQSLISSTTYPKPFTLEQLEYLRHEIQTRRSALHAKLIDLDPGEEERMKREKKERKRKERERAAEVESAAAAAAVAERKTGEGSGVKVKRERSVSPAASVISSSGRPLPATYAGVQFKKKKNRVVDSDDEGIARDRSATLASPQPGHHVTTSGLKVKLPTNTKGRPSLPPHEPPTPATPANGLPAYGVNIDFSLPAQSSRPLIPLRPGVQKPLPPGPKKQSEVNEDFSNTKAPPQVAFPTFWAGVEPYVREIREDDLAMLAFKADTSELYNIPPRGRHYTEVWDEEDGNALGTTHRISVPNIRHLNGTYPPTTNVQPWVPTTDMREENLFEELRGLGSVTERVVAAVVALPPDPATAGRLATEYDGKEAGKVDVKELEERVKKELRAVMLLGEHEDNDDEITASLRTCQRLLLSQTALNDARKLRLAERAKHRLAYAEYQNALDGVESNIEENWAKRSKKYGYGAIKKNTTAVPGKEGKPPVSEVLKKLVAVRKNWVGSVGEKMRERPKGELVGLPAESVYRGIEDKEAEVEDRVEGVVLGMEVDGED